MLAIKIGLSTNKTLIKIAYNIYIFGWNILFCFLQPAKK
ncbi:hypothetical protein RintRC_1316 [Richelia intracellularis]|nr:hypothetical protein RintRC_1316 [Richelia intracellularis]